MRVRSSLEPDVNVSRWHVPDRDGTGKSYMGRNISQVMGHSGGIWLEREGRQKEEHADVLIANSPIEVNLVVADVGAGTGFFSLPVAKQLRLGRLLAFDL